MGKGKLAKFADMASYENVFQYPFSVVEHVPFEMQGHWHEQYFHNQNPIVLELGCGKGEYTVELAKCHPDINMVYEPLSQVPYQRWHYPPQDRLQFPFHLHNLYGGT